MNNKMKFTVVGLCALGLSSCMIMEDSTSKSLNYPAYSSYDDNQMYRNNSSNASAYNTNYKYSDNNQPKQDVVVPDSYHVGEMRSPVSFHDRDQSWVDSQSPQSYTIELANGDKASQVAQKLYKAPKNDRMAQVKYQQGGKEYYRGVYGSYSNAEDAQKALDALPADVKNGASVNNWGSVQH